MKKFYQSRVSVEYSEQQSDQSDEGNCSHKKNKQKGGAWPRFIKNDMELINPDKIVVNISRTQYEVVEEVAEELGWEVETSKKSQKWDILWIDSHIQAHDLFKLNDHQKISHFPAIYVLTKKNFLGRSLMKMSRHFPQQYSFFPPTWSIPADLTDLMREDQKREKNGESEQYYIYKPEAMAQGKGIKIYSQIDKLKNKSGIVQVYVNNPCLIQNLKFDLRIYVLILGYDPLRIFIYDEGLARFATQRYQPVGKKNIKDVFMHLTNYAINKNSKNFIYNKSDKEMDRGHKRSLTAIYKYFESKGVNVTELKQRIDEMIIKTLIVGQPMIAHTYSLAQADSNYNDICFQILGFDVLINENLEPILLQVNHTPSFKTQTPLDKTIKKALIKDTFNLLNVNVENKREKLNKKKEFLQMRSQRKLVKLSAEQKEYIRQEKWKEREEYENSHLGGFRKIFPIKTEMKKYQQMIDCANKIFNEHNGFKNKQNQKIFQAITGRPKSFQKSSNQLVSLPSPIKMKLKQQDRRYNKTAIINKQKTIERFPSISMQLRNSQKIRNFSECIGSIKEEISGKKIESESCSPVRKPHRMLKNNTTEISGLEKELARKGSFLSPKVMDLKQINPPKGSINQLSSSLKLKQQNSQAIVTTTTKLNPKIKKLDDISAETSQALSKLPNKAYNYTQILNSNEPYKIVLSSNLSQTLKASKKYKLPFVLSQKEDSKNKLKALYDLF